MAALAYVLLPISGLVAYVTARNERVRMHGLQAVALGLIWPLALYICSTLAAVATQVAFAVGAVVWVVLMVGVAAGKDPRLPVVGRWLKRAAQESPR